MESKKARVVIRVQDGEVILGAKGLDIAEVISILGYAKEELQKRIEQASKKQAKLYKLTKGKLKIKITYEESVGITIETDQNDVTTLALVHYTIENLKRILQND